MNDCCIAVLNDSLSTVFPMTRTDQCCFHVLKQVKKDHTKHFEVKQNIHITLVDLKQMKIFAYTGMTDSLNGSLKKKHSNETALFDQFDKSHWNGTRKCWISSELGAGIPRANNLLERCDGHVKNTFAENILLLSNKLLDTFITHLGNQ